MIKTNGRIKLTGGIKAGSSSTSFETYNFKVINFFKKIRRTDFITYRWGYQLVDAGDYIVNLNDVSRKTLSGQNIYAYNVLSTRIRRSMCIVNVDVKVYSDESKQYTVSYSPQHTAPIHPDSYFIELVGSIPYPYKPANQILARPSGLTLTGIDKHFSYNDRVKAFKIDIINPQHDGTLIVNSTGEYNFFYISDNYSNMYTTELVFNYYQNQSITFSVFVKLNPMIIDGGLYQDFVDASTIFNGEIVNFRFNCSGTCINDF